MNTIAILIVVYLIVVFGSIGVAYLCVKNLHQRWKRRKVWTRRNCPGTEGCSYRGRPSCEATECLYGCEVCSDCGNFKPIGYPCNFQHPEVPRG